MIMQRQILLNEALSHSPFHHNKDTNPIYPRKTMTATEKLHQLIQTLPENQINEVLNFAEFLQHKQLPSPQVIPPGTLTGLRGIAKRPGPAPSDHELQAEYTDYLTQKYQ